MSTPIPIVLTWLGRDRTAYVTLGDCTDVPAGGLALPVGVQWLQVLSVQLADGGEIRDDLGADELAQIASQLGPTDGGQ